MSDDLPPNRAIRASEVRKNLSTVEQLSSVLGPEDEFLAALVNNTSVMAQTLAAQGRVTGGMVDDEAGIDGGSFSDPETGALPLDAVGTLARDINPNDTGPAVFQVNGTIFYTIVQNVDGGELQAGTSVRVLDEGNQVTAEGAAGNIAGLGTAGGGDFFRYRGSLYKIPRVTEGDADVKVANQRYQKGNRTQVSSDLQAGETKVFAEIEPGGGEFALLKYTNATAHNDVQYNYYIDDPATPDPDLSGPNPWATPPELFEVSPGGFKLVEDFARLEIVETTGANSYSNVQGTLTGLLIEVNV